MGLKLERPWILCRSGVQFGGQYNSVLGAGNLERVLGPAASVMWRHMPYRATVGLKRPVKGETGPATITSVIPVTLEPQPRCLASSAACCPATAVAIDPLLLDSDVTKMDSYTKLHLVFRREVGVSVLQSALEFDAALHGVESGRKLGQKVVFSEVDDSASVLLHQQRGLRSMPPGSTGSSGSGPASAGKPTRMAAAGRVARTP